MKIWIYTLPIVIGVLLPVQMLLNTGASQRLGHPVYGALLNFLVGFSIIGLAILVLGILGKYPIQTLKMPLHFFLGGLVGASLILSAIYIIPKTGSLPYFGLVIGAQMLASLFYDHYGLFGVTQVPITGLRIFGVACFWIGIACMLIRPTGSS